MDWDYRITSDFSELEGRDLEGDRVAVGFRPSGELHVGNLLSVAYAAVIAERLGMELDLMCCDTDWSAHVHEQHLPSRSNVMRLFFRQECPCGEHSSIAEHRLEEIEPFLSGLETGLGIEVGVEYLTGLQGDEDYVSALRSVLENMQEFDEIFGGGFRRRYVSPVVPVCGSCGNSHAKGASFSSGTGELVAACRTPGCENAFMRGHLSGEIGVYYLVDPVRDPSRDVAVHVFGGDYRVAEKEQETPKVSKVARITELATGRTPAYFLSPLITDSDGKPLSKSKGTGTTVSEIEGLERYGEELAGRVREWLEVERLHLEQSEL